MNDFEVIVIGGGVMGVAVARAILQKGHSHSVALLEKEEIVAFHTSGRNSGVVHSGFNLKPGSLKAQFCVEGNKRLTQYCLEKRLPYKPVGTLVVAQNSTEVPILEELLTRGKTNGVPGLRIIDSNELKQLEPHAIGHSALHSPSGAIASGREVTKALAEEAKAAGCQYFFGRRVLRIEEKSNQYELRTNKENFRCKILVNCAGLYADQVAHMLGVGMDLTIIPFRGEYFKIRPELNSIVNSMIYPVPNLAYPFLGVHWTKTVTGEVLIGPNATIAMGRESYSTWDIKVGDTLDMITQKNFWNMFFKKEFRQVAREQFKLSLISSLFVKEAQKLIPEVKPSDFKKGKSGIRAQLVNIAGHLIEDILVEKKGNSLHVLNAVSPGFTSSIPFAEHLVKQLFN